MARFERLDPNREEERPGELHALPDRRTQTRFTLRVQARMARLAVVPHLTTTEPRIRRQPRTPCHRAIIAVDAQASTARTNPDKIVLRAALYHVFEAALQAGGITRRHRDPLINCGDGILTMIRPADHLPKTLLLNQVIPALNRLLAEHNAHYPSHSLRLRAVIHAGEIHYDHHGCFGEAVDVTFRLLDSPELKATLSRSSAPLALVVSDLIYQSVIRHGYQSISPHVFQPLVHVRIFNQHHHGWVQLP